MKQKVDTEVIQENALRQITSAEQTRRLVEQAQAAGETVGFVPTMGALHEGHLSLVDASQSECDRTVVSIFVNPTQFAPTEDIEQYPRPLDRDLELLEERGVWLAFVPTAEEIYPPGFDSVVDVGEVAKPLEGTQRPTHFRGVATVVLKLFQIVPADRAYFGRKDYQQSLVVQQLVEDFHLPVQLRICPIVREADGLAMSSRNAYLDGDQRQRAAALWQALLLAERQYVAGETNCDALKAQMESLLADAKVDSVEYIAFLKAGTMNEVDTINGPTTIAMAARVGGTRLIDNHTIG